MNSVKCPGCNLTNWSTDLTCKRCGRALAASDDPGYFSGPASFGYGHIKPKTGMAISAMVLGILSVAGGCFGGFIFAPVGLVFGIISLVKSNRRPTEYGGHGFAIAGTILSSIGLLMIPVVLAIAIPNLLAARRAANEGSAISSLRTLAAAEKTYMTTAGAGACTDLVTLASKGLVDSVLASGQKSGYRFLIVTMGGPSPICELHATPMSNSTGTRSFLISTEDNVLRSAQREGQKANRNDPPLETGYSRSSR